MVAYHTNLASIMDNITTLEVILFLVIDFVILATIVAGIFFLVLYLQTRKQKRIKTVNLGELEAFKNKTLETETNFTLEHNKPVAPSSLHKGETMSHFPSPPMRTNAEESTRLFHCQMQENEQQMNSAFTATQSNTNYFNL